MEAVKQDFIEAQQRMLDRHGVPAESRFFTIPMAEGRVHALLTGPENGPPVVMISGIGCPAAMWAPLMARLGACRIYAVDLPAYGLTEPIAGFTDDLRAHAVRFLSEVRQGLGLEAPAFISNSLGSLFCSWLALDRPSEVSALVHIGCPAVVLDSTAPLPMRLLSVGPLGRLLMKLQPPSEAQVEELSRMVNEYPLSPELAALLLATERLPGFESMFLAQLHRLLRLRGSRPGPRLKAGQLQNIAQPSLIVWGAGDPMGSVSVGERMAELMPRAKLQVVDAGHAPWLTQSEQIAPALLQFLHGHD